MTPEEEKELAELEELDRLEAEEAKATPPSPDAVKAAELTPVIDPSVSIPAQVLSTQPATSSPKGDEAAAADWMVQGTKDGKTVVYEPPLAVAKKDLLSNPQLVSALFPDEQIPPEFIQQMDANSDIYKAYADHKWNDARWAAADSGTTAYRYSKAPWLHGQAAGLSPMETLATKAKAAVNPIIEGANALILGVDDTAAFGAGRAAGEAIDRATGNPTEELNQQRIEEYPGLHTAGQAIGMFSPGGVMGLLGKGGSALTHAAGSAVAKAGGGTALQVAGKLAGAGAAAVAGGTAAQAGREGVQAASNLSKTGETGTTLGEAAGRSVEAGLDPMNLGLGVGGEAAGMLASGSAKAIANLPRYEGNVERLEQLGGQVKFGHGPVGTAGAEHAIKLGKARDISPQDVIAERIAPKIAEAENAVASGNFEAAKAAKEEAKRGHAEFKKNYFATSEGQAALPPVATMETNLKQLRSKVTRGPGGELRPVGNAEGVATARAEFSGDVAQVTTKPVSGAIELSPEEAELFLAPSLTSGLVPRAQVRVGRPPPRPPTNGGAPPVPPAPSADAQWLAGDAMENARAGAAKPKGGGTNPQGVNVVKGAEAPTVPPKGKEAKAAGKIEAIPDRDLKKTIAYDPSVPQGRNEYGEAMHPHRDAQRADNRRASALDKEFSPETPKALDVQARIDDGTLASETLQKSRAFGAEEITPQRRQDVMTRLEKSWTPAEKEVANGHVMARFYEVNDALRSGKMTPEVQKTYESMAGAFDKAVANGNVLPGRTMRGISVTPEELKRLEGAKVITAQGFVSQSNDPKIAKQFSEWGLSDERPVPVLFEIDQVSGVPVGKGQGELVHRPGTQYHVVSSSTNADGTRVFKVRESGYSPGASTAGIIGGGLFAIGAAAATGDDNSASAMASAGGLALALKKRGITKVYAVPRRYDAQQHEVRIGQLQDLTKDPKAPGAREAKERYAAALRDRDQRPLDGQPGGWSARQQQVNAQLTGLEEKIALTEAEAKRKGSAKRDAPGGTAQKRLVRYSKQRPGELPLKKEIETAGKAAGVEGDLRDLRLLDPLTQLRGAQAPRKASPGSKTGIIGSVADAMALRAIYPGLHSMGSEASHLRGGLLGTKALQLKKKKKDEEASK